ncbi:MAG: NrfD/PsrC family molybdoenzyme membrane anchor subunit [Deltaproteobacteria bacterium]|nr:NrfD/PsrC family molybdoenzyme membrane anchor subunit [Deltaproteobacteria bacterium]
MTYLLGMKQFEQHRPSFRLCGAGRADLRGAIHSAGPGSSPQGHVPVFPHSQFHLADDLDVRFVQCHVGHLRLKDLFVCSRGDLIRWANAQQSKPLGGVYRVAGFGQTSYDERQRATRSVAVLICWPRSACRWVCSFMGPTGPFLPFCSARPVWNSAMTPLLFIVAALLSGGVLITFLTYVFRQKDPLNPNGVCYERRRSAWIWAGSSCSLLVFFLALEAMQFSTGYTTGIEAVVTSLNLIVLGPQLVGFLDCASAHWQLYSTDPAGIPA